MTLSFHIEYRTNWGEEVRVSGSVPELGGGKPEHAHDPILAKAIEIWLM